MKQRFLLCTFLFILGLTVAHAQGITVSGTVYDDGTESSAIGTPINVLADKPLYANLSYVLGYFNGDEQIYPFYVQASVPIAPDGTYSFSNVTSLTVATGWPSYKYRVSLSIEPGVVGSKRPSALLLPYAINEGAYDYHFLHDFSLQTDITIGSTDLTNINFSLNQLPKANPITAPSQQNPDDVSTQVTVPTLTGSDPEDGIYDGISGTNTIGITTIPSNGTLFYDGKQITNSDLFAALNFPPLFIIKNYDPAKLKIHPNPGNQIILFSYYVRDVANRWSNFDSPARVRIAFTSTLASYDFGDAGNPYESATIPAQHRMVAGLQMGQLIDTETAPFLSSYQATGDDLNIIDDEDGIVSFAPLSTTNTSYSVIVSVLIDP